ncbi:response regulator [Candidatus Desantisbacteria bacterium]|nr:response regulator [Candidatus Desantisbacteria bacterium]
MAKILIVDDETDLADMLGMILKLEGYQITSVLDGYKAIEEIKNTHYDLILMDIKLPGINGVETFIQIKGIDPSVKVMMMTGYAVEDLIEKALEEGAYACIHKPFDLQRVIELIRKVISENKKVVLIVNGDRKTREDVSTALTEKGYYTCTAANIEEMLVKLKDKYYHCILLNLRLPGINGLKVLKEAKKLCPDVVVIVMTDYDLPKMVREEENLSVYAVIKKPIDVAKLIRLLKEANL